MQFNFRNTVNPVVCKSCIDEDSVGDESNLKEEEVCLNLINSIDAKCLNLNAFTIIVVFDSTTEC
jgi:hypothetical protein